MLKIVNINKYFNRFHKNQIHVIDNTSLEFKENGLVAFLGHSGSGKTTLLNIIGGLDKFQRGKLYINGKKINRFNHFKMDKIRDLKIGYIFQDYKLVDNMSVYDNIALSLKMIGVKNKKEIKKRVDFVLFKTNMYRYRNRMANMLSGGERQRVGIARALVKNPDIILADEPTGNLDSKNSIEIMNIIKAISKTKLVILVTHEVDLANFYADRIIEIKDGKVIRDYENNDTGDLDYRMDNMIYLKDFKYHNQLVKDDMNIDVYSNTKETTDIKIIFKNGNIYIESNGKEKIELIDDNSSIEVIDDHYKKISKDIYEDYSFDIESVYDKKYKLRYSSIYNPITLLINGFKKVFSYSILKKILLVGFFITGIFITYSISSVFATIKIDEKNFVTKNKNYLSVNVSKLSVEAYNELINLDSINYVLPNDSLVGFKIKYDKYYQSTRVNSLLEGSLASVSMITENDIIYGNIPNNDKEIVVDKMILDKLLQEGTPKYLGITDASKFVGLVVNNVLGEEFTISGVTDLISPSIYAHENKFIDIIYTKVSEENLYDEDVSKTYLDYNLYLDKIKLTKGRLPVNDYEIIVNEINKEEMKLDKEIDKKINGRKLKVVGYYTSYYDYNYYFTNETTIKNILICDTKELAIYANNNEDVINNFRDKNMNIKETYKLDKEKYLNKKKESIIDSLIVSAVIIGISLIEIFLMIRSSFLSRIKEIGVLRAIGVKKLDIIKMFLGEIIAITTIAGVIGVICMSYILNTLLKIKYLQGKFVINLNVIIISIIILYAFNIIVGLFPVFNVIRKTPAQILSRHDIE